MGYISNYLWLWALCHLRDRVDACTVFQDGYMTLFGGIHSCGVGGNDDPGVIYIIFLKYSNRRSEA